MSLSASERRVARSSALAALVRESAGELELEVQGGCMRPWLETGDRVTVAPTRLLLPGDVVALAAADGRCLVHRFLGFRRHRGRLAIVSRADDAETPDFPVPVERVLGRVTRVVGTRAVEPVRIPWRLRVASFVRWLRLGFGGLWRSWRTEARPE